MDVLRQRPGRLKFERLDRPHTTAPSHEIAHTLHVPMSQWARIRRRRALVRSPSFRRHRSSVDATLRGFSWSHSARPYRPLDGLCAVAWNIERGKQYERLRDIAQTAPMASADLLLLTEVDVGMARSGNRHVAQALAADLDMDYVYCNHHLVLCPGDLGERHVEGSNTLGCHGSALLSRLPIARFASVPLPEFTDKFESLEKRLGCKRALLVEVLLDGGALTVVVIHLDPFSPPWYRAAQLEVGAAGCRGLRRRPGVAGWRPQHQHIRPEPRRHGTPRRSLQTRSLWYRGYPRALPRPVATLRARCLHAAGATRLRVAHVQRAVIADTVLRPLRSRAHRQDDALPASSCVANLRTHPGRPSARRDATRLVCRSQSAGLAADGGPDAW